MTLIPSEIAPELQSGATNQNSEKVDISGDLEVLDQDRVTEVQHVADERYDLEKQVTREIEQTDQFLVTFSSPDDLLNPLNWPNHRKWTVTLLCSMSGLVTLMSGTMMAPALAAIGHDLRLDDAAANLTLSIFVLAFAFGPILLAPISEIYGRRPVWLLSGVFYVIFNTVCGFAQDNATMVAARFLAGIGASVEFAVTNPVLADCWRPEQRGLSLSISMFIPLLGTAIGPIIGGVITDKIGWRWLFWIVSIFSGLITVVGFFFFEEPYAPVILARKAKALRKSDGRYYYTGHERASQTVWQEFRITLLRPIRLLLTQPTLQMISIFMAYDLGINYIMLATFAQLWTQRYGQTVSQSGLNYIAIAIGNTLAAQVGARVTDRVWARLKSKAAGVTVPEYRVPMMIPGSLLIPIGLLWYGWAGELKAYWLITDIGVGVFATGIIFGTQAMQAYVLDSFPEYTASATAASQFLRSLTAFAFPIFAPSMYQALGYGWGNSVLAFLSLLIGVPAPLLLWKFGARLRAKGKVQW
ncbi:hypothetical protein MMC18_004328 [Xylographa bjoerkii]|nr:hypothetical protein [Xylographa bjoerkii]